MKKRYITANYKLQILLSEVEGIEIVDIVFEFPGDKGYEVHYIKENLINGGYKVIDNFNDLKNKRKELINNYYRKKGE